MRYSVQEIFLPSGGVLIMRVAIDISNEEAEKLSTEAERLGVTAEQLARSAIVERLDRREDGVRCHDPPSGPLI